MPKTYNEIREEFLGFKSRFPDDPTPLSEYAKQADLVDKTPGERAEAYEDGKLKQVNAAIDRGFRATGLPQVIGSAAGGLASGFDALAGTNVAPTVERVAEEIPRGVVESVATIPLAASGAGAPAAVGVWANRINQIRKFLKPVGYASTGLQGYASTDSPLGAVINMGSMKAANKLLLPAANEGMDVGLAAEKSVRGFLEKGVPPIDVASAKVLTTPRPQLSPLAPVAQVVPPLANIATQAAVAGGINEATRQASMSVGPRAVGPLDPSRNPLTPENIAGQVVGAAPFAPQVITSLAARPRFGSGQIRQYLGWGEARRQALEESGILSWTPAEWRGQTPEERQRLAAKGQIFNAMVEEYRYALQTGDPIAEKYNKVIQRFLDEGQWTAEEKADLAESLKPGTETPPSTEPPSASLSIEALSKQVADAASMPSTTAADFGKFRLQLDTLIDQINENVAKGIGEPKFEKGKYVPPAPEEKGKTWHPTPTSAAAVRSLEGQGLLPKLDDAWFQTEMSKELDRGVDPNTALEFVKQRAANLVLDAVPEALRRRAEMPVQETGDWKAAQDVATAQAETTSLNQRFAKALTDLPMSIREGIIQRTLVYLNQEPVFAKFGNKKGRQVSQYGPWRLAVIKATESYNPDDGTILMYAGSMKDPVTGKRTAQFRRAPISDLVNQDEAGNYRFEPRWTPVSTMEGGKATGKLKGKTIIEGNLESMVKPENVITDTMADEADYDRALAEEGAFKGSLEDQMSTTKGGEIGGPAKPEDVLETGQEDSPFLSIPQGTNAKQWEERVKATQSNIARLTDAELYSLAEPAFATYSSTGKKVLDPHEKNRISVLRYALLAMLETMRQEKGNQSVGPAGKAFLKAWEEGKTGAKTGWSEWKRLTVALKDFFKKKTPVADGPEGLEAYEARFGKIVQAVLDEKRVEKMVQDRKDMLGRLALGDGIDPSVVISENGIPIPFFHGTDVPLDWGKGKIKKSPHYSTLSLSTDPDFANMFKGKSSISEFDGSALGTVNVIPGFVKAGKYWDYANVNDRIAVRDALLKRGGPSDGFLADALMNSTGDWAVIEQDVREHGDKSIFHKLGYEGIWTTETHYKGSRSVLARNLHIFDPDKSMVYLSKGPYKNLLDIRDVKTGEFAEKANVETFSNRVRSMLATRIDKALGAAGYSGSVRQLFTEMATALAMQVEGIETRFYKLENAPGNVKGITLAKEGIGRVGMALNDVLTPKEVHKLLKTLAHEIHHIQQLAMEGHLPQIDAFSQHQRVALSNLRNLAETLTPEERHGILLNLQEALVPKEYRDIPVMSETKRLYGSETPAEFTAAVAELTAGSLLNGRKQGDMSPFAILQWMPTEVEQYAQGFFRSIEDIFDGVQTAVSDPAFRKALSGMEEPEGIQKSRQFTADALATVLATARGASGDLVRLRQQAEALGPVVATMSPGAGNNPPMPIPEPLWTLSRETLKSAYAGSGLDAPIRLSMEGPKAAVEAAREVLYRPVKDPTTRPGIWAQWFAPFTQLMYEMERKGVPLARPLGLLSTSLAGGVKRTQSQFLHPFVVKQPDGTIKLDQQNPLVHRLSTEKTGGWRDAINAVSRWQQERGADVTMFVKDPMGNVIVNNTDPKIAAEWKKIGGHLKPEDQQLVMNASVALDDMHQLMAARIIATLQKSTEYNVAATLIGMYNMDYDKAKTMAESLLPAYRQMLEGATPEERTAGLEIVNKFVPPGPLRERMDGLLVGPDGLVARLAEVRNRLLARVGHRTESLPGEFVIQFRKPDAKESELSYLSARTEAQANHLAKKLQDEGNVIVGETAKKSELRDYTDFDSPDGILRSFIEAEKSKWRQMVDKVRETHGEEVAKTLQEYSPGVESERFLATKGMGKHLVERGNKVDRSRFDYIDAAMEGAQRLATTLEYRLVSQEKNLILADPRARNFPSLKPLVNNHFDELMTPGSRTGQEMRTFAAAYMMGGSLASAVINGSQSLTTLIPVLIQNAKAGGIVNAYQLLSRNLADAVKISTNKDWQAIAARAEAKSDHTKWTLEEAKYALYKRNVEEGGIDHGVILDDIFSGTDTRSMLTTKFGRGDYGPVTKAELARNGMYLAAQLALRPFGWVEKQNNKIALLAGIEQGYEKGLRGEALYDYARTVKSLATFGGGKANAPGLVGRLSTQYTRSAVGAANVLQQYGYGVVSLYAQQIRDALGASTALTPLERRQAQKAFLTMFSTQVALGGALGLPFFGAALGLIEQLTGIQAQQTVREGLASLGNDDEAGATIAETALNGLGNQMFGFDVSSRLGVSTLLGMSAYRGFNLADMVGPTGSILQNAADALNYFGQQRPDKAIHALVPNALRTSVELYNNRDQFRDTGIRDQGGNLLYSLTPNEASLYALGFRPRELSLKRQMQKALIGANQQATKEQGRQYDEAARALLEGDTSLALQLSREAQAAAPMTDVRAMYRSIVDRAVDAVTTKDLLASGPTANADRRQRIAQSFAAGVNPRQSEVDRTLMSFRLGASLGLPPDQSRLQRAAMIDALVSGGSLPRSEALRLVEMIQ